MRKFLTPKILFRANLAVFLVAWLGITGYTLLAILRPEFYYSRMLFWIFLAVLDVLALPLMWLWYEKREKTITHKTGTMAFSVVLVTYWGFAALHSMLSLHTNDLQFRWLSFAYIWEVVIIGGLVAYLVTLMTRYAKKFVEDKLEFRDAGKVHARILGVPFRASLMYVLFVLFGYSIGSLQLRYFSQLPYAEISKNLLNGCIAAILSSFVIFFLVERIVSPARKKSGQLAMSQGLPKRRSVSLFTKIYAVSGLLALVSVIFMGTTTYGRSQMVLEEELKREILHNLHFMRATYQVRNEFGDAVLENQLFGPSGGAFLLVRPQLQEPFFVPDQLKPFGMEAALSGEIREAVYVDRTNAAKLLAVLPLDDLHVLSAVMYVDDFDFQLFQLVLNSAFVFLMLIAVVAIVGTLFAYAVTHPLEDMREGAIRMGKGDFSKPIRVYTTDELEDLSNALNEASAKLHASYGELEDEIARRTEEIQKINEKQQQQIRQLDQTAHRLVRRDFELQKANEQLREIDEAKSQFVSIAAHQLRTPLSAIKWTFSMLLSHDFGSLNKDQEVAAKRASESTDRVIVLVNDLLNVARIESGQTVYKAEAFRPEDLAARVVGDVLPKASVKNIEIALVKPRRKIPEAKGDAEKLGLVFQNILENAVRYTPAGGKVKVKINQKDDVFYEVIVSDTGIGIPAHQMSLLFQKFFRANNALRFSQEGTGLGLYIALRIVENHGGTIHVESKEGKGSVFTVTLPFHAR